MAILSILAAVSGCSGDDDGVVLRGTTMGTTYTVKLAARPGGGRLNRLGHDVGVRLVQLNAALSTYDPASELSRFNRSRATTWAPVSADLATVADAAQRVAAMTGGAFDATVQPLVDLWGFGPSGPRTAAPGEQALAERLAHVGYERLEVQRSPPALRKSDPRLEVDLSAIAKGYAIDELGRLLSDAGFDDWMVEIGGEIRVAGTKAGGRKWQIAVEQPGDEGVEIFTTLSLSDAAIASSGNYRNFFVAGGKRYTHVLDPRSGRPVDYGVGGITVVHEQAMYADAYATALLVLDPRAALAFAERHGLAVVMFEAAGSSWVPVYSERFEALLGR